MYSVYLTLLQGEDAVLSFKLFWSLLAYFIKYIIVCKDLYSAIAEGLAGSVRTGKCEKNHLKITYIRL